MSLFVIGDLHLSFGCNKPMDIFHGWENHTEILSNNWNNTVGDNDTVIIPGDISWAMTPDEVIPDLKYLDSLNGKKIILKGNHDYWWQTSNKLDNLLKNNGISTVGYVFNNAVLSDGKIICGTRGWQIIGDVKSPEDEKVMNREVGRLKFSLDYANKLDPDGKYERLAFFHYPPVFERFVFDEMFEILKQNNITKCYFGHLHGKISSDDALREHDGIMCQLISADYINFSPLKLI